MSLTWSDIIGSRDSNLKIRVIVSFRRFSISVTLSSRISIVRLSAKESINTQKNSNTVLQLYIIMQFD